MIFFVVTDVGRPFSTEIDKMPESWYSRMCNRWVSFVGVSLLTMYSRCQKFTRSKFCSIIFFKQTVSTYENVFDISEQFMCGRIKKLSWIPGYNMCHEVGYSFFHMYVSWGIISKQAI